VTRPPFEVADVIRRAGSKFISLSQFIDLGTAQSAPGNRALPHRRARWPSRPMSGLPASIRHLFPLMPKSPLPEVSDQREGEVAARPAE